MKAALSSKFALSPLVLIAISIPGIIAVPLTEAQGSLSKFAILVSVSLLTVGIAAIIFLLLRPLYESKLAPWWFTIVISTLCGCLKGFETWLLLDVLGYAQPTLASRVIFAGLSWAILIPVATVFAHSFLELRDRNRALRFEISDSHLMHDTLDQQLEWLIKTRIDGLSKELASKFVKLVSQLNQQGLGPKAYQDLAQELRAAAKEQVRNRSMRVWKSGSRQTLPELVNQVLRASPNLWVVLVVYAGAAVTNTLRIEGLGIQLLTVISTAVLLWGLLKTDWLPGGYQHGAPLVVGLALALVYSFLHFDPALIVQSSIASLVWAEVSLLCGIAWNMALSSSQNRQQELEHDFHLTEVESAWLSTRLESNNFQVAKYLHSILQTRLMAYAMKIENNGQISDTDMRELETLLTKPFIEFGKQHANLEDGLAELTKAWATLTDLEVDAACDLHDSVDITLQVVSEAVANAVRHGRATSIEIRIRDESETRHIRISDNGSSTKSNPAGLGTKIFDSVTIFHNLEIKSNQGAIFRAEIALR